MSKPNPTSKFRNLQLWNLRISKPKNFSVRNLRIEFCGLLCRLFDETFLRFMSFFFLLLTQMAAPLFEIPSSSFECLLSFLPFPHLLHFSFLIIKPLFIVFQLPLTTKWKQSKQKIIIFWKRFWPDFFSCNVSVDLNGIEILDLIWFASLLGFLSSNRKRKRMSSRVQIEKWSRNELEDKFHSIFEQNANLRKSNNRLENELKKYRLKIVLTIWLDLNTLLHFSTSSRRSTIHSTNNPKRTTTTTSVEEEEELKADKLKRENQILTQKVFFTLRYIWIKYCCCFS